MLPGAVFSVRFLRQIQKIERPEEARRFLRLDRYWLPEVAEALLTRIDSLVPLDPKRGLGLAEIALELVGRIRSRTPDLQAHAFCALATAYRCLGRLNEAENNYLRAETAAKASSILINAMIMRQKAILFVERGDLEQALDLAKRSSSLHRSSGAFPTKSLIIQGIVHTYRQEHDLSAACFREVVESGDPSQQDYLFAANNLVAAILRRPVLATEIADARKMLRGIQERIRGVRETPVRYIVWYLEGILHGLLGEYRRAVDHLMQARNGFLRMEMISDFTRVTIDLVEVLVKKGDVDKARAMIQRTAQQLGDFEGYERFVAAFQFDEDQQIQLAPGILRDALVAVPTPAQSVLRRSA